MKVRFLTFEKFHNRRPNSIGSSKIRARWLWEIWNDANEYMVGEKFDVAVFQKVYWIDFAKVYKGIKILDMCDPDFIEGAKVVEMINECDAVTTSTEVLAEAVRQFTKKPVVCVPDRLRFDYYPIKKRKHTGKAKKALWFGYSGNQVTLTQTLDYLYENGYELVVYSDVPFVTNKTFNLKVTNIKSEETNYDEALAKIAEGCDLLLNPKLNTVKFRYKSNNKSLIAWSMGLPVVDENPEDLERYKDPKKRNKEVEKKQKELKKKWDIKFSIAQYNDIIKEAGRRRL